MAYPGADLVRIDASGMTRVSYEETEQYRVMRHFMLDYRAALREIAQTVPHDALSGDFP